MATATVTRVNDAHRLYVKSLYKRYLTNALNWAVQRDVWRQQALEIRAEFDKHKNESDPKLVQKYLADAESKLAARIHPDPYISAKFPGGTGWERNLPPPPNAFVKYDDHHHADSHAEAVEEIDILPPEDRARLGHGHRLSSRALSALQELVLHAHGAKNFVDAVADKAETGVPTAWNKTLQDLQSKGIDTRSLETDIQGKKFSEYTDAEKQALVKNFEGSFWEHMDMRARGIIDEEISHKRDREDGVYR